MTTDIIFIWVHGVIRKKCKKMQISNLLSIILEDRKGIFFKYLYSYLK